MPKSSNALGSGVCGYNSICSLDRHGRTNYSPMDPSDTQGSCKPDFIQDHCEGYGHNTMKGDYKLVSFLNTDWPSGDYAQLGSYTEEECKPSCLNDCFCAAVIVDNSGIVMLLASATKSSKRQQVSSRKK